MQRIAVTASDSLAEWVQEQARKRGVPKARVVLDALRWYRRGIEGGNQSQTGSQPRSTNGLSQQGS